jgi:hypothetical protein
MVVTDPPSAVDVVVSSPWVLLSRCSNCAKTSDAAMGVEVPEVPGKLAVAVPPETVLIWVMKNPCYALSKRHPDAGGRLLPLERQSVATSCPLELATPLKFRPDVGSDVYLKTEQ